MESALSVHADYRGQFKLRLIFNDGVDAIVDFSDWLGGPVFEPLKAMNRALRDYVEKQKQ
ncbi:MAG TPA: hypothetical protein VMR74_10030 [Gammaproteobacteria bacterium]|nr:hypothetical protein [Gammaproteobacteria bacterium]